MRADCSEFARPGARGKKILLRQNCSPSARWKGGVCRSGFPSWPARPPPPSRVKTAFLHGFPTSPGGILPSLHGFPTWLEGISSSLHGSPTSPGGILPSLHGFPTWPGGISPSLHGFPTWPGGISPSLRGFPPSPGGIAPSPEGIPPSPKRGSMVEKEGRTGVKAAGWALGKEKRQAEACLSWVRWGAPWVYSGWAGRWPGLG